MTSDRLRSFVCASNLGPRASSEWADVPVRHAGLVNRPTDRSVSNVRQKQRIVKVLLSFPEPAAGSLQPAANLATHPLVVPGLLPETGNRKPGKPAASRRLAVGQRALETSHARQPAVVVTGLASEVLLDLGMRKDQESLIRHPL